MMEFDPQMKMESSTTSSGTVVCEGGRTSTQRHSVLHKYYDIITMESEDWDVPHQVINEELIEEETIDWDMYRNDDKPSTSSVSDCDYDHTSTYYNALYKYYHNLTMESDEVLNSNDATSVSYEEELVDHQGNTSEMLKSQQQRLSFGQIPLLKELSEDQFINYTRLDREAFNSLENSIMPFINKCTKISLRERLALTLRFLATGNSFADLSYLTAISPSSVRLIITEICEAIIKALKDMIKLPENEAQWKAESKNFLDRWQFPHCLGAIDGKHVNIKKPHVNADIYQNYKGDFSIVLTAITNAKYEFLMVDIGTNGATGDSRVLKSSPFYSKLLEKKLKIPAEEYLPNNSTIKAPFVFIGDSAFENSEHIIKPYSYYSTNCDEIRYNNKISRARVVVESSFGILASRFRILYSPINSTPEQAKLYTRCCCYLHNYILKRKVNTNLDEVPHYPLNPLNSSANINIDKKDVREKFKEYFKKYKT